MTDRRQMPKPRTTRRLNALVAATLLSGALLSGAEAHAFGRPTREIFEETWTLLTRPFVSKAKFLMEGETLDLRVKNGFGLAYRMLSADEMKAQRLNFSWRVDAAGPATDFTAKGKDDRPIAVHVWFAPEDMVEEEPDDLLDDGMFGDGLPEGRAITYVFGATNTVGIPHANPFLADGRLINLRTGGAAKGVWFNEMIDLAADYKAAFGSEMTAPVFVAISADSEDTNSLSAALIRDLKFQTVTRAAAAMP
ncbi:MAG: DUF3047 domain-containing protein [Pseudomonadota bacterium]